MYKKLPFLLSLLLSLCVAHAQQLKPGFNKEEYSNLMKVSAEFGDSSYAASIPVPSGYKLLYRSPIMGLDNLWDLWATEKGVPIISIRGTTSAEISWMANFYAAMVPAKGTLILTNTYSFDYNLAANPRAAVHTGWLISTAFLVQDMLPKIDSLYKAGKQEFLIMGHSQGGAIAFLLTAHLRSLQLQNKLPTNIRFKTYCSAGPKPGNLYFAHEYEAATQEGWAYNVVNSADWVPETPVTVQTLNDFNQVNPFINANGIIKKQSFFKRLALNYAYGKLRKPNDKAAKNYKKFLGTYIAKTIKKHLPYFEEPVYAPTIDYVRTGNTITLLADEDYFKLFSQDPEKIFIHHFHPPYLYLLDKLKMERK